ncbi:hypothetical protein B0H10DRAFT_105898 [Mycena sp. CBHHK59/15]|nr:hypothetical protein B0H10DRAFT_105898 [Mycena sp. CBHHK59/15]
MSCLPIFCQVSNLTLVSHGCRIRRPSSIISHGPRWPPMDFIFIYNLGSAYARLLRCPFVTRKVPNIPWLSALASYPWLSYSKSDSRSGIALALFDSQLDQLKLPVLKHPADNEDKKPKPPENVAFFVQKYFDLVAVFEEDPMFLSSSQEDEKEMNNQRRNRLQLFHRGKREAVETYSWVEQSAVPNTNPRSGGVIFIWDG